MSSWTAKRFRGSGALALCCLLALAASACAPRTAVTHWGYSSWFREGSRGEMGAFDRAREACLQQAGITDAETVEPNSPEEDRFVQCMNAADWCTTVFHCSKPD